MDKAEKMLLEDAIQCAIETEKTCIRQRRIIVVLLGAITVMWWKLWTGR